jgi:prepilin-type N-terminal cleavage/methylation domain-containing protein
MIHVKTRPASRSGFTLIEMMVAVALTLFLMTIISQAFVSGLELFSQLKAIGDMEDNLRVATTNIRSDLQQDHFEAKRRLSDLSLANPPLRQGFFLIWNGSAMTGEGVDTDGLASYRATNHGLYFTIKLRGNRPENFLSATVPLTSPLLSLPTNFFLQPSDALYQQGSTFNSQWAEVAYFLVQTGSTVELNNPASVKGTPLYALYRSQYVLVPNSNTVIPPATATVNNPPLTDTLANYATVSCIQNGAGNLQFNGPDDVINSANRALTVNALSYPQRPNSAVVPPLGSTLVLSDVVSFNVQVMVPGGADFGDLNAVFGTTYPAIYDTSTTPLPISALQISIRTWDIRSQQTRQITIIQDM